MAQNFPDGVIAYGPTTVKGTGRQDATFSGIPDCGVWADSNAGAGLLGSCNTGFGVAGMVGDPAAVPVYATRAGVLGSSKTNHGVVGVSDDHVGVIGHSDRGAGIEGSSRADVGVEGVSEESIGVYGLANAGVRDNNPNHTGVQGESIAPAGTGVLGINDNPDLETFGSGVHGVCWGGMGVLGESDGGQGVWGDSLRSIGVVGTSEGDRVFPKGPSGPDVLAPKGPAFTYAATGVSGTAYGNGGIGVHGQSISGPGVFGYSYQDYAGFFAGKVYVSGSLVKAGGGFRIDHPLDAANSYLNHSFVESPEMKNLYDGVAVLNQSGQTVVTLPKWFLALNKDFRYQLTAIGAPGPDLHIAQPISKNRFKIAGGKPRMKVSWQITGIRQDAWAKANPMKVEEKKPKRGYYLHPELFGQPVRKRIDLQDSAKPTRETQRAAGEAKREGSDRFKRPPRPALELRGLGGRNDA
jgi:hypothetical protein